MQKCNLCLDKGPGAGAGAESKNTQDDPLEPACVDECVGDALHAGPIGELMDEASEAAARKFEQNPTSVIVEPQTGEDGPAAANVETPISYQG